MATLDGEEIPGGIHFDINDVIEETDLGLPPEDGDDSATPNAPRIRPPNQKIVKGLTKTYAQIGMMVFAFDQPCGQAILTSAESMATSLAVLAEQNAAVKRVLLRLIETSAWGMVLAAHAPLVLTIVAHHTSMMDRMGPVMAKAMMGMSGNAPTDS